MTKLQSEMTFLTFEKKYFTNWKMEKNIQEIECTLWKMSGEIDCLSVWQPFLWNILGPIWILEAFPSVLLKGQFLQCISIFQFWYIFITTSNKTILHIFNQEKWRKMFSNIWRVKICKNWKSKKHIQKKMKSCFKLKNVKIFKIIPSGT